MGREVQKRTLSEDNSELKWEDNDDALLKSRDLKEKSMLTTCMHNKKKMCQRIGIKNPRDGCSSSVHVQCTSVVHVE